MIYSASAPKRNQQGNGECQTGKGERLVRVKFEGKSQTPWSSVELWSADHTSQFVLNCGKGAAILSFSCTVSYWLRAAGVGVVLDADKLAGAFKESQVLVIRKEKQHRCWGGVYRRD